MRRDIQVLNKTPNQEMLFCAQEATSSAQYQQDCLLERVWKYETCFFKLSLKCQGGSEM